MLRRLLIGLFLACSCAWLVPSAQPSVRAQADGADPGATDAAEERAQSFRAVTGGVQEDVPGGPLTVGAYAVVWIVLFAYVWRLNRLQRGVEVDLQRLERSVTQERATLQPTARQSTAS